MKVYDFNQGEWIYYEYKLYCVENTYSNKLELDSGTQKITVDKVKCRPIGKRTRITSDWFLFWEHKIKDASKQGTGIYTIIRTMADKWLQICDCEDIAKRENLYEEVGMYMRSVL